MKKSILFILIAAILLSMAACSHNEESGMPEETNLGTRLREVFLDEVKNHPTAEPLEVAETLSRSGLLDFDAMSAPVEEGYLMGFDAEIHGFEKGAVFGPSISTIAFVGYVFQLEDGADGSAFVTMLESHADLRWNVCTFAEHMVTGRSENLVYFVMCP